MSSQLTATFAPNDVSVVISQGNFSHIVSGFSSDSIVTVERNSDSFDLYTGADNSNTRIYMANTSAKVTLPLQQTSNSNDILTQLHDNDIATRDSSGLFTLTVKDNSGRSIFHALEAYIAVVPNSQFGSSMQLREWVIHAVHLESYIGGNAKFTPEDQSSLESLGGTVTSRWSN